MADKNESSNVENGNAVITLCDDDHVTLKFIGVVQGRPTFQYTAKQSGKSVRFTHNDGGDIWLVTSITAKIQPPAEEEDPQTYIVV